MKIKLPAVLSTYEHYAYFNGNPSPYYIQDDEIAEPIFDCLANSTTATS